MSVLQQSKYYNLGVAVCIGNSTVYCGILGLIAQVMP